MDHEGHGRARPDWPWEQSTPNTAQDTLRRLIVDRAHPLRRGVNDFAGGADCDIDAQRSARRDVGGDPERMATPKFEAQTGNHAIDASHLALRDLDASRVDRSRG